METIPIELLERICGPHRQVVGRIRQVCAAFQQIRGDWDVLYYVAETLHMPPREKGEGLLTIDGVISLMCSSEFYVELMDLQLGDKRYEPADGITNAGGIVADEYIRMLRPEVPVLVAIGSVGGFKHGTKHIKYIIGEPGRLQRQSNTYYFGFMPAADVHDFDRDAHDLDDYLE